MPLRRLSWLIALFPCVMTGCAALSLFSTTHQHHYEASDELQQRVESLEHRVMALEQGAGGPALSNWRPVGGETQTPERARETGAATQTRSQAFESGRR